MSRLLSRFFPLTAPLAARIGRRRGDAFAAQAEVQIAPAEDTVHPPVFFDPSDWDRVTALQPETTPALERDRIAGGLRRHGATMRYLLRDALVTPNGVFTLRDGVYRHGPSPFRAALADPIAAVERGFYAASSVSLRYFGHFANDALPTTLLQTPDEALALPFDPGWSHGHAYLDLLGICPIDEKLVWFRELWFSDDRGMNAHRRARMRSLHRRIQDRIPSSPNVGVFLRRGDSGAARLLVNEDQVADRLAGLGYAICDVTDPLPDLLGTLAGARVVVTMEGSQWVHAHYGAAIGALIVIVNPADRFNNIAADMAPALDQRIATIVAPRDGGGYRVDPDRLIALIQDAQDQMVRG